jgi:hypothetical protein
MLIHGGFIVMGSTPMSQSVPVRAIRNSPSYLNRRHLSFNCRHSERSEESPHFFYVPRMRPEEKLL